MPRSQHQIWMKTSMDSSMDGRWEAKVDQLELEEVIKKTAIKFSCSALHRSLLNARIQSPVRRLILDPIYRACRLSRLSQVQVKASGVVRGHASSRA